MPGGGKYYGKTKSESGLGCQGVWGRKFAILNVVAWETPLSMLHLNKDLEKETRDALSGMRVLGRGNRSTWGSPLSISF